MNSDVLTAEVRSSETELQRLIDWSKDNQKDWRRICNPDSYDMTVEYLADLVERLYEARIYTLIYVVIFSSYYAKGMEQVLYKTVGECFLDVPIQTLMKRFRNNLRDTVEETA